MTHQDSIQYQVRLATGFGLTIATVSVVLRLIARRLKRQQFFIDDILIFVALIFQWGIAMAGVILLQHGLGLHVADVEPTKLVTYLKVLYTGALLYSCTIVFIKLSLLVLYHRLFPVKFMTYSCLVTGTVVVAWGLTSSLMGLLICTPVRKVWQPMIPGQCLDLENFYYGIQVPNIITDIVILVLPMKMIYGLNLSKRQKLLLTGLFGLGILVVIFDIIRLVVMIELANKGPDFTWNQVPTSVWTCVEPAIAITTACLSHLKPIVDRLKRYWKPRTTNASELSSSFADCISGATTHVGGPDQDHYHKAEDEGGQQLNTDFTKMRTNRFSDLEVASPLPHGRE